MRDDMVARTFRVGVVLWAALALGALFVSRAAWLGVLLGGGLGLANFWLLANTMFDAGAAWRA
jgi:hypothetical protein